jgi:hypothetical protein
VLFRSGYEDGEFKPNEQITRAEFVTMAVRFYGAYYKATASGNANNIFTDLDSDYWAVSDIYKAISKGWIIGYADGTFRADNQISRAEAVTVVNRVIERVADKDYINKNIAALHNFNDISTAHWAFYDIMEASNSHNVKANTMPEAWRE